MIPVHKTFKPKLQITHNIPPTPNTGMDNSITKTYEILSINDRPAEDIKNEFSVTNGYEFKLKAPVTAKSGKKSYDLFSKGRFAWVVDNGDEQRLIVTMKKASRLMIIGNTEKDDETTDHYSMMGFTKAYNAAKKNCS